MFNVNNDTQIPNTERRNSMPTILLKKQIEKSSKMKEEFTTFRNVPQEEPQEKTEEQDLEDGEIEDDGEELPPEIPEPPKEETLPAVVVPAAIKVPVDIIVEKRKDKDVKPDKRKHDDKGKKHMTDAERSILHLRKREEMQRKKWEKIRPKDVPDVDDDFAKKIEKTLATILNKKEKEAAALTSGGEEKDKEKEIIEVKRGKKRKKNDKDHRNKQRRLESPKSEIDENEMLNMLSGRSPDKRFEDKIEHPFSMFPMQSEESFESECSSDANKIEERVKRRENKKGKRNKDQRRDRRNKDKDWDRKNDGLRDSDDVCVFYLQGKCQKDDCPYSHEAVPPMKLELCKFYLMDCCAKGDKCSYMHSEFPCKFYHTGLKCSQGDDCKFAHGKPLSDGLRQILFKHIETAPRDILGGFPRMSREEALNMINATQTKLQEQHGVDNKQDTKGGIPSLFDISVPVPHELLQGNDDVKGKLEKDKPSRNRPSRWQDPEPVTTGKEYSPKSFNYGHDQDMRISSNGDVDMRTLPPAVPKGSPPILPGLTDSEIDLERYKREAGLLGNPPNRDVDIRSTNFNPYPVGQDVDIRQPLLAAKDIDIRQMPKTFENGSDLQIDTGEDKEREFAGLPTDLPRTHRDLFLRIKTQQKEVFVESEPKEGFPVDDNINWYSDDDDDDENRLTIKVDNDDFKEKEEESENMDVSDPPMMSPPQVSQIKPQDVVEKLGDLSKIDISAEVTKLLTSMSKAQNQFPFLKQPENETPPEGSPKAVSEPKPPRQDPRMSQDQKDSARSDPRLTTSDPRQRSRQSSTEVKPEKLSIYEQGSIDRNAPVQEEDIDIRGMRSDVDLRHLQLPFKGMRNYTPASEIDASLNCHPPIPWRVDVVEIPRPDYAGLKLSAGDAEKTGDPRLRKIFRLTATADRPDAPASPPKQPAPRADPRLRKPDYRQQLTMLRGSAFYQSLTEQQKMLLNRELSLRDSANESHDPVLNNLLTSLDIVPGGASAVGQGLTAALAMLAPPSAPDCHTGNPAFTTFPAINFDPRNGGLLGNAPPPPLPPAFPNFAGQEAYPPFDGFYAPPPEGAFQEPPRGGFQEGPRGGFQEGPRGGDGRGFNRDRRRGGRGFHGRGNRGFRNNRNNRANRTHSPP